MVNRRKVGLLGGTFDPIHIAHLIVAEACRSQLGLERVFFIPAGAPPHKLNKPVSLAQHRFAMTELAIASNPYFTVSRLDIDRPGPCYSTDTVRLLSEQLNNEVDLYFIIGTDSLMDMPTWHEPLQLIGLCRFAVVGAQTTKLTWNGWSRHCRACARASSSLMRRPSPSPLRTLSDGYAWASP